MFEAGISWNEALTMPLSDSLDIAEIHLDKTSIAAHRQGELVWASIAPHTKNRLAPPEPPRFDE